MMIDGVFFYPLLGILPPVDLDGLLEAKDEVRKHKADNNSLDAGVITEIIHQSVLHTSERQNRLIEEPSMKKKKRLN
jgi:hypothetical protein